MISYDALYQDCDREIRAGRSDLATRKLLKINPARVPREWRLKMANLCRRVGLDNIGIRLLADIVYRERARRKSSIEASPAELVEYGVLLHRCGANQEALKLLLSIDSTLAPETLLYQAFCYFNDWNHLLAISAIEKYLSHPITPYMRLVARVNLAVAYVSLGRHREALEVIAENIELAKMGKFARLEGNSHEMCARAHLNQHKFAEARKELALAQALLGDRNTRDAFLIRYHSAIIDGLESGSDRPMVEMHNEALRLKNWELAREADQFALMVNFEKTRFERLYFGSPATYRQILNPVFSRRPESNQYYLGQKGTLDLDLRTGFITGSQANKSQESLNGKCLELLAILIHDFYRPQRMGSIFTQLFRQENFSLTTSPGRIHQLLFRLRKWATDHGDPFEIYESAGYYMVEIRKPFSFILTLDEKPLENRTAQWLKVEGLFGEAEIFTAKEARTRLNMSEATMLRLLRWAVDNGKADRLGTYNTVRYRRRIELLKAAA